jgi:hypothetical protein
MQIAVCLSDTSSPTHHPDALPQRDARLWPARHGCPVGPLCHLTRSNAQHDQRHKSDADEQHYERDGVVFEPMPITGKH